MFPIPIQRSMVFLRKTELMLLKALVKDVEREDTIRSLDKPKKRSIVKPEDMYFQLSLYRYVGEHYSDCVQAAKVLEQLGLVKLVKEDNTWRIATAGSITREAAKILRSVSYGFKPMERRIITLISLAMRFERPVELSDAREIIGGNGPAMRFIMRKSDMMVSREEDGRYYYQSTDKGRTVAQAWLDFSRAMIIYHGGALPRQFVVHETTSLPALVAV